MGFRGVEKKFNGCLRKVSKVFQGCFKEVLRVLNKVLSMFKENLIKSFKGVSRMKCCFATLL